MRLGSGWPSSALSSAFAMTSSWLSGDGWSGLLACWCGRHLAAGCVRGVFGDLGVSCVASSVGVSFLASVVFVGGVCRMVSGSVSRVSAVRFCPERCMGVCGDVRTFVVSACVLSAELWWLESFPWVMVLGGGANVGCVRLPGAGCSV